MTREEAIRALLKYAEENKCKSDFNGLMSRTIITALKSPWISVKDELPKEDGVYYVGNIKNGWKGEMTFRNGLWHTAGYQSDITHWMPIPPLNEEE